MRKSIWEWAVEYCGDPQSHFERGKVILEFLKREGLRPEHRVLDVGCGALSQGKPLIEYLDSGNYTGLDPNGWLIEAALHKFPELMGKFPSFSYDNEFTANGEYDFVVAHSVLSHVASWQMDQALANIRKQVTDEAVFLASLRLSEDDTVDRTWVYPGVSFFRLGTVIRKAHHWGWDVVARGAYQGEMTEVCPNDFHDWVLFRAVRPPGLVNQIGLEAEQRDKEDEKILELAKRIYRRRDA